MHAKQLLADTSYLETFGHKRFKCVPRSKDEGSHGCSCLACPARTLVQWHDIVSCFAEDTVFTDFALFCPPIKLL